MPWLHLALAPLTFTSSLLASELGLNLAPLPANAQVIPGFCQTSETAARQKLALLQASVKGDLASRRAYEQQIAEDARQLQQCRSQNWPRNQAIWLRVYECDLNPGVLDALLDRIASRGYNQVYVEVFYNSEVLLPANSMPTPWSPVVKNPAFANRDLLAEVIQKGRQRGMKVYAWMFSLNFGRRYGQRPDRQASLARNGQGKTSFNLIDSTDPNVPLDGDIDQVFVDPYDAVVRQDYGRMLQAVLQRRPDGVLFDYIRYPRQTGGASVASRSTDLWIFGRAAQQAFINRALNPKGTMILQRYLQQGYISVADLKSADSLHGVGAVLWQGRQVPPGPLPAVEIRLPRLQRDLWLLSVAHAYQGIVDYLTYVSTPVLRQGIPAGAVFFPDANREVGQGYDSRMQPWHRFPQNLEWHAMSYGICGDTSCIVDQVQRVLKEASSQAQVKPVIAGQWGRPFRNRPSLEQQMYAIRQVAPGIQTVSHFDFSWQDPQFANARRSCRINTSL